MKQVIYVDVLISVNLIVNYFILLATAKFLRFSTSRKRIILASILASFYSLYIFFTEINIIVSLLIKGFMSLSIVAVAFGTKNKKRLFKSLACFYSSSFGFCGVILGLWYLLSANNLTIKNSVVYINISPTFLLVATVLSYIIIRLINTITGRQNPKEFFCDVKLENDCNSSKIRAKVDTGNTLREPFSNIPVIVADYKCVENIMPKDFKNSFLEKTPILSNSLFLKSDKKFRIIPYNVVSSSGVLPAFKPDKVTVYSGKIQMEKDAYVAVCCSGNLGAEFEALVSPELIEV